MTDAPQTVRVLLDSCVWAGAADEVRAAGYDVACVAGAMVTAHPDRTRIRGAHDLH